jgi:hypothetical protein
MSNTTLKPTKAASSARMQAFIAGTQKHFPNGSFTLGNTVLTADALIQLFTSLVSAITAVDAAHASAKDAVAALRGIEAKVVPVARDYRSFLLTTFGTAAQSLADFSLQPPKARTPLTAEQRAAAQAKAKATRIARGTTGKKKKLAVTGNVTGVQITPVTVPAAAAPAEQQASNASNTPDKGVTK